MGLDEFIDRHDLRRIVGQPRSMTRETIVEELVRTQGLTEREARRVMFEAIKEGAIEEHPQFNGTYVFRDDSNW